MKIPFTNTTIQAYNMLSCKGFEESEKIGLSFGACAQAKLMAVVLFFINAIIRKWVGEEMGVDYSFFGGLAGSMLAYIVIISITGNVLISFIVGIVGMGVGGFLGGRIFGGGEEGYE